MVTDGVETRPLARLVLDGVHLRGDVVAGRRRVHLAALHEHHACVLTAVNGLGRQLHDLLQRRLQRKLGLQCPRHLGEGLGQFVDRRTRAIARLHLGSLP